MYYPLIFVLLAFGRSASAFHLIKRTLSWDRAREFCQTHYVDLAVLNTEEQYLRLRDDIAVQRATFWLGLRRDNVSSSWKWKSSATTAGVNYEGRCGSLEAVVRKDRKLLTRYCAENHNFVCQGPVAPQQATLESLGPDHASVTWNVSASMRWIAHTYNVTVRGATCDSFLYAYDTGGNRTTASLRISNLTSGLSYLTSIAAVVTRPDNSTGETVTLESGTVSISIVTGQSAHCRKMRPQRPCDARLLHVPQLNSQRDRHFTSHGI
ncbi:hypothetical protein NHX12_029310 [Muraenolepis orangiensis]|uniref:C-type lectin domain-containing protein n=1 Tax=Muraenolepis orangiensis TaxID=630683 RepID=A0A9Q0INE7_9TELE|nr:hypothetical protein NHX12_029310 [Muraenolepis orangiensis]